MHDTLSRKNVLQLAASFGMLAASAGAAEIATGRPARAASAPSAGVTGAWSLERFDVIEPGKAATPRFGVDPVGYLIYTPSGRMSAILSGIHRPPFESTKVSAVEGKGQTLTDFLAYAGTYDIRGDRVFHHVEVSVFTNLVGTTLERQFTIDGDRLTIRTITPGMWGDASTLVWKRTR